MLWKNLSNINVMEHSRGAQTGLRDDYDDACEAARSTKTEKEKTKTRSHIANKRTFSILDDAIMRLCQLFSIAVS